MARPSPLRVISVETTEPTIESLRFQAKRFRSMGNLTAAEMWEAKADRMEAAFMPVSENREINPIVNEE